MRGKYPACMHRCPQCDYAYGPLPGVPSDRFGRFTADVRCPECAFEVPAGALLLTGSSAAEGAQPLTVRRRGKQVLLALAPSAYLLMMGFEALARLLQGGAGGPQWSDMLFATVLAVVGWGAWATWRRWSPSDDGDARAPISYDTRWLCEPGALRVFSGTASAGKFRPPGDGAKVQASRGGVEANALPVHTGSRFGEVRYPTEDIRSVVAHSTAMRWQRWRTGDRAVAALTASIWHRDRQGQRSDMFAASIHVDTGAESGPPGRDRTTVMLEVGDAITRSIRQAIGMATAEGEAGAEPAETIADSESPTLVIEGALHAQRPWPAPVAPITMLFLIPLGVPIVAIGIWMVAMGVRTWGNGPALAPWMNWAAAIGAVTFTVAFPLARWTLRRARLREMARCRWDVGPHGIRVTERHVGFNGETTAEFTKDIPSDHIAAVAPNLRNGRLQLVASNHAQRALASITPDAFPEGSAEALAQAVRQKLCPG